MANWPPSQDAGQHRQTRWNRGVARRKSTRKEGELSCELASGKCEKKVSRDPAERPHRPVDVLFYSLAEQRESNAIGIILSGAGSDGAKGIQAIKQAGGI